MLTIKLRLTIPAPLNLIQQPRIIPPTNPIRMKPIIPRPRLLPHKHAIPIRPDHARERHASRKQSTLCSRVERGCSAVGNCVEN